jgi:prolipoprotein diacylglyceryltransferase
LRAAAIDPKHAGLSVFGAFAANLLFLWLLLRRRGDRAFARVCDASASSVFLTFGLARFGCLLAGCCFGAPASTTFATIPLSAYVATSPAGAYYAHRSTDRIWATQPIEAFAILAIATAAELLRRRREAPSLRPGAIAAFAIASYAGARLCESSESQGRRRSRA